MRVRQAASKPNIMKIYSYTWLYPNKPSNVTNATKQASGPKDQQATNPQMETKQEQGKEPISKQTSMDLKQRAWTRANKA